MPAVDLFVKRARLAACLAISNLGFRVPEDAAERPESWSSDPQREVENLAGHLMESDTHERIFATEARAWYKDLSHMTRAEVVRIYGQHHKWVEPIVFAEGSKHANP